MEKSDIREQLILIEKARKELLGPRFIEIGLTLGQGQPRILKNLYQNELMTQRMLADICGVDVTTMSRTLDRMEEAGLLERRKNPNCRRSYQIALTEDGRVKAEKVIAAFAEADDQISRGFQEHELEELLSGLARILKNLTENDRK